MKNIVLLLFLCVSASAFPSCEKLGFESLLKSDSKSIVSTKWKHVEFNTDLGTVQSTLSFSSSTFSLFIIQSAGTNQLYSGNYEYSKGAGTLYLDGDKAYVTVSGNFLTLSWGGINIQFTKE